MSEAGEPFVFLAQICFADSKDLVTVPGDVLLIFAVDEHGFYPGHRPDEPGLRFEWYPLGLANLIAPEDLPKINWKLLPCYAKIQRQSEKDGAVEGAKIGGQAYVIQHKYDSAAEFFATLGQVRVNTTEEEEIAGYEALRMADDGLLNLHAKKDGYIAWDLQSY